MLDLLIAVGVFAAGSTVFIYAWTRLMIMFKTNDKKLETFLTLMCPANTLSFWSIDVRENWRLFSKVTRYYRSKHFIDGKAVGRVYWWAHFLNDTAIKN